jgi:hypothetical protein
MTTESLLAVALWMDELEAKVAALTLDQGHTSLQAYQDRDAELDAAMVKPLRERLEQARKLLEERATAFAPRESWPAGGSWLSRAYALAKSGAADLDAVELELAALRGS